MHRFAPSQCKPLSPLLLVMALGLTACGGGGNDTTTPPLPTLASTTISGAVVKGPVDGAQVCAFTLAGSARGAALGTCTTTDASGNYSFNVPVDSGALWLEASGGTYTDEATSAAATLPAESPLVGLVAANGSSVSSMLTPLTTLALNAARRTVGSTGTLDIAAFQTATNQLLTTLGLPSTLNISTAQPTFGASPNDYGTALATISRMVANGTALASILATTEPQLLKADYDEAANPAPTPGTGIAAAVPAASGTVTVAGATASNAATSLTPQASGFEISVEEAKTTYRFFRSTPAAAGTPDSLVEVKVMKSSAGAISASYYDLADRRTINYCSSNCGISISTPAGATHPVTLNFAATPLFGGLSLNGSLVGDVAGALWSPSELPRSTDGQVNINGVNSLVTSASDTSATANGSTIRTVFMFLADGSQIYVNQVTGQPTSINYVIPPTSAHQCPTDCKVTFFDSAAGVAVDFDSSLLSGAVTLKNSISIGKTQGSLTSSSASLGGFTPIADSITSLNDVRTINFNNLGTAAQAGLSMVSLSVRNGIVLSAQATVGIGAALYSCTEVASVVGPACTGITLGANGRQVTFLNTTLAGGAIGAVKANVNFTGTLTAKGL